MSQDSAKASAASSQPAGTSNSGYRSGSNSGIGGNTSDLYSITQSSGGGSPPPNLPPTLLLSGGGTGGSTSNGTGTVAAPIPVGSSIACNLTAPNGYTIQSVVWKGGSEIATYPLGDATQPPPTLMSPTGPPLSSQPTYVFVVDADPRTYAITASVAYTNNATGQATITFTSKKPPYSWNVSKPGQVFSTFSNFVGGNPTDLVVGELVGGSQNYDMSTQIKATTGPVAAQNFTGTCMFLQLIESTVTVVQDDGNKDVTATLKTDGFVIDDGFQPTPPQPLGQNTVEKVRVWPMNTGVTGATFYDAPSYTLGNLYSKSVSLNDSFETYLMYKPNSGAWVALSEFKWNLGITQTNSKYPSNAQYLWSNTGLVQPNPTQSTPSGLDAFPLWISDCQAATVAYS